MERVHYLGGGGGVQSPFDAIAVQTVTLFAMNVLTESHISSITKTNFSF